MKRNIALDILKLMLAFMVVGLHSGFLKDFSALGQYLTVNGIFRIAVPIFLVINGFYFYHVLNNNKARNWFQRVFFLYLFWMLFYSYFWFRPSDTSYIELMKIVHKFLFGYFHLWYLPGMLGAAVLVIIIRSLSLKLILSSILIMFFVGVAIQYMGNYHSVDNKLIDKLFNMTWVHRNLFFLAFPFFFIGYLINKFNIKERISLNQAIILSFVGVLFLLSESYFNYINPFRDGGFDNYISLLLVCPAIFLVFINLNFPGKSKQLSFYATSIYFIHPLFLSIYDKFTDFEGTSLTFVIITSSVIASYFLIKINDKVKFIL